MIAGGATVETITINGWKINETLLKIKKTIPIKISVINVNNKFGPPKNFIKRVENFILTPLLSQNYSPRMLLNIHVSFPKNKFKNFLADTKSLSDLTTKK